MVELLEDYLDTLADTYFDVKARKMAAMMKIRVRLPKGALSSGPPPASMLPFIDKHKTLVTH